MDLLKLRATLGLDSSEYESGLNKARGKAESFGSRLKTGLGFGVWMDIGRRAVSAVTNSFGGFLSGMDQMNTAWKGFESNMMAAGHTPGQIAKAKKEMQDFAAKSQFYSSKMAATYAQLDAVGVKSTGDLVKGLGGIAAASAAPQQAMDSLSLQATQMAARPTVAWGDFQVMLQHSPAGMAEVARQMGMSLDQLVAKIQSKQVTTQELFAAIGKIGSDSNNQLMKAATTYKSIGDAMEGVKGYMQAQLAPAFDVFSQFAIGKITGLFDIIAKIDKEGLANWTKKLFNAGSLSEAFNMLTQTVQTKLPQVVNMIMNGINKLLTNLSNTLPSVIKFAATLITTLVNGIANNLPKLVSSGLDVILAIGEGIANNLPQIVEAAANLVVKIVEAIVQNLPKILYVAGRIIIALAKGIIKSLPKLIVALVKLAVMIPAYVLKATGKMLVAGGKLIYNLWVGIKNWFATLFVKIGEKIKGIPKAVGKAVKDMFKAGVNLVKGLWNGIKSWWKNLIGDVDKKSKGIGKTFQRNWEEHSPSRLFFRIGKNLSLGLAMGIEGGFKAVDSAVDGINGIVGGVNEDLDMGLGINADSVTDDFGIKTTGIFNRMGEEIQVPVNGSEGGNRDITIILEMDSTQFARAVYRANNEETQRVGVSLSGSYA